MAELKTQRNDGDVDAFLESVDNETRRRDAFVVKDLMTEITGDKAEMWGTSIVGFGAYRYGKDNDREWMKVGFSPRKQSLTLYIMDGFSDYEGLLEDLGPHSTGKSCLYIKDLEKVDKATLTDLITKSVAAVEARG